MTEDNRPKVKDPESMSDEVLMKHLNARHLGFVGKTSYDDTDPALIHLWRRNHETLHRSVIYGANHTHDSIPEDRKPAQKRKTT